MRERVWERERETAKPNKGRERAQVKRNGAWKSKKRRERKKFGDGEKMLFHLVGKLFCSWSVVMSEIKTLYKVIFCY